MAKQVKIRWVANVELSAAHAAHVVATGAPCVDAKTEQLLVGPVTDINNRLLSASLDVSAFWNRYVQERIRDVELGPACTNALAESGCSELQIDQMSKALASKLGDARLAFTQRFPKLADQLDLRARPLREKWESFGPGLLRDIGRQVWEDNPPNDWWHSRLMGLLVQPIRGGDGGYDAERARLWVEAMLTDADPEVPEVLRVAWLVTRIAIDTYVRERSGDASLAVPWSLVSIPLVLTAAINLELIRSSEPPIQQAMQLWQVGDNQLAQTLGRWWSQYRKSDTALPAALKVLEHEIG